MLTTLSATLQQTANRKGELLVKEEKTAKDRQTSRRQSLVKGQIERKCRKDRQLGELHSKGINASDQLWKECAPKV